MTTPPRPVWSSSGVAADADLRPAAVRGRGTRSSRRAVEVGDHAARDGELHRDHVRLARAVVDEDQPRRAGDARARSAFEASVQTPRRTSAIAPRQRAGRQRAAARVRVGGAAAEEPVDRLAVRADDRADVDERLVGACPTRPGRAAPSAPANGIAAQRGGRAGATTSSAGAKTWSFETAATEIASGAVPGEPAEPSP